MNTKSVAFCLILLGLCSLVSMKNLNKNHKILVSDEEKSDEGEKVEKVEVEKVEKKSIIDETIQYLEEFKNPLTYEDYEEVSDWIDEAWDKLAGEGVDTINKDQVLDGVKSFCKEAEVTKKLCERVTFEELLKRQKAIWEDKEDPDNFDYYEFVGALLDASDILREALEKIRGTAKGDLYTISVITHHFQKFAEGKQFEKFLNQLWEKISKEEKAKKEDVLKSVTEALDVEFEGKNSIKKPMNIGRIIEGVGKSLGEEVDKEGLVKFAKKIGGIVSGKLNKVKEQVDAYVRSEGALDEGLGIFE